jgi:biuret amidohydrolase
LERAYGLEIPQSLEETCKPDRVALVIYDMQVGILRQLKDGLEVLTQVVNVLRAAREAGLRVFFMRHMSLPKEVSGVFQLKIAMAWQRVERVTDVKPWFLRDSPGFQLVPEVAPLASEVIFDKITMSAFESTPLNIVFRDCGINAFIIVGVATEIGIEPTVRHGADLGYIPIIVTDACGSGNKEAAERALASLRFMGDAYFTNVVQISEVLRRAKSAHEGPLA